MTVFETFDAASLCPVTILAGHYGTGKTNLAVNLALGAAAGGREVVVVDLDVVNPYFRASDYKELLEGHGVRLVAPVLAGTTLDGPSLSGKVAPAIQWAQDDVFGNGNARLVIIDAGGDDVGATALGRFAQLVEAAPYCLYYVVNRNRNLTQTPDEAVDVLREIEAKCRLRATAVVNNTHLSDETDEAVVAEGLPFAHAVADQSGLAVAFSTAPQSLVQKSMRFEQGSGVETVFGVQRYVRTPWE
ncbi:ParA family protein [Eggerthellaceae bacterium zg-887]|uniref:ParA family protein n=1 Tax=Xiamenia xianingshaonis TaxID=2682776 RepID=UPI00140DC3D8|nr:ParA family protein [Xiamenia xianingshaonis]NHM16034.1 ParA family protein [Xiamenia xianingshaonis]